MRKHPCEAQSAIYFRFFRLFIILSLLCILILFIIAITGGVYITGHAYGFDKHYERRTYGDNNYSERIKFIILHHSATASVEETRVAFNNDGTSAHYIVDKEGKIHPVIAEEKSAWHAGNSAWEKRVNLNDTSIGIEMVNSGQEPFPIEQIRGAARLTKAILEKYKILPKNILAHYDIAPGRKFDPSSYFDWRIFYEEAGLFPGLYNSKLTEKERIQVLWRSCIDCCTTRCIEENEYREEIKQLQQKLNIFGYNININGYYDLRTRVVIEAFNRHFCPEIFKKETMKRQGMAQGMVQYSSNQRWYGISNERLAFLLDNMQSCNN